MEVGDLLRSLGLGQFEAALGYYGDPLSNAKLATRRSTMAGSEKVNSGVSCNSAISDARCSSAEIGKLQSWRAISDFPFGKTKAVVRWFHVRLDGSSLTWLRGGRGAWRELQGMEKGKKFGKRTFRFGSLVTP